jgi:SAM-dependent methyltransferase
MNFKRLVKRVYGVDPDPRVLPNPYLDEACIGTGDSMPMFAANQFDVIICCNVLEHLPDPVPFFQEVNRVLKRGGLLITKTPNRHHYVPLIAKIVPAGFRSVLFQRYGWNEANTFPTFYREFRHGTKTDRCPNRV